MDYFSQLSVTLLELLNHHWMEEPPTVSEFPLDDRVDLAAVMHGPLGRVAFLVECKSSIRPSEIAKLAQRLERNRCEPSLLTALNLPKKTPVYGLLAAPWISRRAGEVIEQAGLGWFDLAGNCHISVRGFHDHREGIPNPYVEESRKVAWSSEKAQLVLRTMLHPENVKRSWRLRELVEAVTSGVSLGMVQKVTHRLLEENYAVDTPNGVQIANPSDLLIAWGQAYKSGKRESKRYYTPLHGAELQNAIVQFSKVAHDQRSPDSDLRRPRVVYAAYSAAKWYAPFGRSPFTELYIVSTLNPGFRYLEDSAAAMQLQTVPEGENVVITQVRDEAVFWRAEQVSPDLWATNPIQTYLDLVSGGERGQEAAEHLLKHKIIKDWQL
tara:strand:+ start:9706 stop:10851 length:1146 start_codon:yes stop_codon:yes gene_type:complete